VSARRALACMLAALATACGGEFFALDGLDAGDEAAADASDAQGDAADGAQGDDGDPDGGHADVDPPFPESGAGDGPLCCDWIDAGQAHATACGASSWACFKDSGPGGHPCIDQPNDCRTSDPCILNDISHGYIRGEVRVCP